MPCSDLLQKLSRDMTNMKKTVENLKNELTTYEKKHNIQMPQFPNKLTYEFTNVRSTNNSTNSAIRIMIRNDKYITVVALKKEGTKYFEFGSWKTASVQKTFSKYQPITVF